MTSYTGNSRRTSSKPSVRRKYLGDASDPHFIPDSPIISRQSLTFEEEEELTKVCTLVLSEVPHSDDNDEDPLMKYIASQLVVKQPKVYQEKGKTRYSKTSADTANQFISKQPHVQRVNDETATPSITSKRDTIDRTNTSTPMTVLSETVRRPSSTRQTNALRNESKSSHTRAALAGSDKKSSTDASLLISATHKSVSYIPDLTGPHEQHSTRVVTDKLGNFCISHVEFNKSLPALPEVVDGTRSTAKQSRGLSRIFRTNKPSDPTHAGPTSATPVTKFTEPLRPSVVHGEKSSKRHTFNFMSLFERKRKSQPRNIAVS